MAAARARERMRMRPRLTAGLISAAVATTVGTTLGIARPGVASASPPSCVLAGPTGPVNHVISLVFDNVHFTRDNPNVPSDLEQMPHLLNFLEQNGALLSNEHTPLIAHTADDILTTLTGVYGDKHGQPVANSYLTYNNNGSSTTASSFAYWTDPVASSSTDQTPTMIGPNGKTAPAPWVPYTRAGCDVGGFSTANIEVENADPDLKSIYGANSPQWASVLADEKAHGGFPDISDANYQGIAVHCAQTTSSVCAKNPSLAAPDNLPDEPGGYNHYQALYGNVNVAPVIGGGTVPGSQGVCVNDLNGNPLTNDFASGDVKAPYCGFPGFDPTASQTLAYVADMQEHGIPVTYGYIEDAHADNINDFAYGPGQPAYVAQLKSFDDSFATFFARLQKDGITPKNTLFEVSSDEGDHFAGSQHPTPTGCNGVTVACTYGPNQIGEVSLNLHGQLKAQYGSSATNPSTYSFHSDTSAPFYINGNPQPGDPAARTLELQMAGLQAFDQHANNDAGATVNVTKYLADQVEESVLHFDTADPNRVPTFTDFANPDFFMFQTNKPCTTASPCVSVSGGFAWNHGAVAPEINTNWVAFAGPGVTARGVDSSTWADETDVRPTLMSLLGLTDDYTSDGRVLVTDVTHAVLPDSFNDSKRYQDLLDLEDTYKQLNADVGTFGLATLQASTTALSSTSSTTYTTIENDLTQLDGQRDALAAQIETLLNGVEFGHQNLDMHQAETFTAQGNQLIADAEALA